MLCKQILSTRLLHPNSTDSISSHSYGYQTNTRVKFVLILALADAVIRDVDVKTVGLHPRRYLHYDLSPDPPPHGSQIFRAIHHAYIGYLSNPFSAAAGQTPTAMAAPIRSKRFTKAIRTIAGVDEAKERE